MNKTYLSPEAMPSPALTPEELRRIGRFTRKAMCAEDLYAFPLILCDNEIDRDMEQFGTESLSALAEMFVGKSGIFDHSMSGRDQTARIYAAECRTDPSCRTQTGEPYTYIYARAYMPRIEKNADLIAEIDSGIKKETSVGCAVAEKRCSVCGADVLRQPCVHRKGETYDGRLCYHILQRPTDAYEWSFVAVPAQRNAGVTKSYSNKEEQAIMQDVLKSIREQTGTLTLSGEQVHELCGQLDALEAEAALGKAYRADLAEGVMRAGLAAMPDMDGEILRALCDKASVPELKALQNCFGTLLKKRTPAALQLCPPQEAAANNHAFQI